MSARQEAINKIVDKFLLDIREFADCAQVLCSFEHDDDKKKNTSYLMQGTGNVYARIGLCRQYLIMDDQSTRRHSNEIAAEKDDPEE